MMNDKEGKIASYLHETFHKLFTKGQPQITDFLQTAEQRQGMDAIDRFAKSKAKYPLLGMQLSDTLIFGHTHRPWNIVSKAASQVGDVVKRVVDAGSSAVKQEVNSLRLD